MSTHRWCNGEKECLTPAMPFTMTTRSELPGICTMGGLCLRSPLQGLLFRFGPTPLKTGARI